MVWIKRFSAIIAFLLILILLVSFTASNSNMMQLKLFGWTTLSFKTSSFLISAYILGGLSGLAVSMLALIRLRLKNASLLRKLGRRDKEIKKLRDSSLKGLTDA
ncbi:MAG: hypothetical protein PUP46_01630 [Endozoicomonas sp. (ex Botrylloides leachii)]|nr:hypothetical protein [Endozoicomonas sp. (ex Botrylloides leachii)]